MSIEKFKELIEKSTNIVFFGGAGVSTESNIPDFRSSKGLYNNQEFSYEPEKILSHSFFKTNTEEFFRFYRSKMIYKDAKPNKTHFILSNLEESGKVKAVITQNIDGLHQMAGSKKVVELHGSVHRNYCIDCGTKYNLDYVLNSKSIIPKCNKCGGVVRPDVVLYEESLNMDEVDKAIYYIEHADMLIVGGTSLVVYPAANLVRYYNGDKLILINKSVTPYDDIANLVFHESISDVLSSIMLE